MAAFIPGPVVSFDFDLSRLRAKFESETKQLQASFQREGKKTADKFASDLQQAVTKLRANVAQGKLGLPEIQAEQRKIIALADAELKKLQQKAQLTKQELSELKRITLERERAANAIARGVGVGVTAGTTSALSSVDLPRTSAEIRKAATSAALLERMFGIQLPRAVNQFIGSTQLIGPALGAAFKATVVLFLIQTLLQLPDLFHKLGLAIFDFGGKSRAAYAEAARLSEILERQGQTLKDVERRFAVTGISGPAALRIRQRFAIEDLHEAQRALDAVKAAMARGEATGQEFTFALNKVTIAQREAQIVSLELNDSLNKLAQEGAKKAEEELKRLNERTSEMAINLQKIVEADHAAAMKKLRDRFAEIAVDLNQIKDLPVPGVPTPEDFKRQQDGQEALRRINEEWLRSTGQTVALIQLEYERDLENFQDLARAKGISAQERADAELKLEQIKNEKIRAEREKELAKLKQSAEQLFDAALAGAKTFGDAFKRIMIAAILAPVREAFANAVARILGPIQQRIGGIFTRGGLGSPTAPGGTGTFSGKPIGGGTVSVPAGTAQVNTAQATIQTLAAMTITECKLMHVTAATVVLAQKQGAAGAAFGFLNSLFPRDSEGGSGGGLFGSIFKNSGSTSNKSIFSTSGKELVGRLVGIGIGGFGLVQATKSTNKGEAILTGAASGAQIGGSILPGLGHAIGAVAGALFGSFFGGPSPAEIFERNVQRAIKRQTEQAKRLISEPMAFRFANLATLGDTFNSTFSEIAGGGFIASRGGGQNVNINISAIDTRSFGEAVRRSSAAVNAGISYGGGGRFASVMQRQMEPA
jgi:hypothetical protein